MSGGENYSEAVSSDILKLDPAVVISELLRKNRGNYVFSLGFGEDTTLVSSFFEAESIYTSGRSISWSFLLSSFGI
jgi:hypothetical protein